MRSIPSGKVFVCFLIARFWRARYVRRGINLWFCGAGCCEEVMDYPRANDFRYVVLLARVLGAGYFSKLPCSFLERGMGPVAPYLRLDKGRRLRYKGL